MLSQKIVKHFRKDMKRLFHEFLSKLQKKMAAKVTIGGHCMKVLHNSKKSIYRILLCNILLLRFKEDRADVYKDLRKI